MLKMSLYFGEVFSIMPDQSSTFPVDLLERSSLTPLPRFTDFTAAIFL